MYNGTDGWFSTLTDDNSMPAYQGIIASMVAVVFFGSNFVPVKKFETGDGKYGYFRCIIVGNSEQS